jgi:Arc/MetJ-type ribon-helix-helix transcriptional regulator
MDISVSLPDDIQAFVEAQTKAEGYASVEAYLLALIR